MLEQNKGLFDEFRKIHNKYELDPEKYQDEFNLVGQAINDLIRKYENKVCGKSERSVYSKFSSSLADKFRAEVRKVFPKIDFILETKHDKIKEDILTLKAIRERLF